MPAPGRGQHPDQGRTRLSRKMVSAPRSRTRADRRRRGLLPDGTRAFHQAAGTSTAVQYRASLGVSLRLRSVSRAHAALLPDADRSHRPLQPALPDLLCRFGLAPARLPRHGDDRTHARCGRRERGRTRCRADFRRRADLASAVLRDPRCRAQAADPSPDGQHQRPAHCERTRVRGATRDLHARLRVVPAVRFAARRSAPGVAWRTATRHPLARAGTAQQARHLDHARRHGQERTQRPRTRRHHRLRAAAALRARRDLPADPARRPRREFQSSGQPADADRSAPPHPRTEPALQAR